MAQWIVENYYDTRGRAPVDEYLRTLPPVDLARVLRTIDLLVDYGPLLKMPHVRHLTGKIWELRIDGRPNSYGSTAPHVPHLVRGRARTKVCSAARIQEEGAEDPV
jgi:hypothetical protein